jgi:hypothetical protein
MRIDERTRWVAGLQGEGIDEQVQEDDVALGLVGVGEGGGGETVLPDERGVHVVEHVGPDHTDVCTHGCLSDSVMRG